MVPESLGIHFDRRVKDFQKKKKRKKNKMEGKMKVTTRLE